MKFHYFKLVLTIFLSGIVVNSYAITNPIKPFVVVLDAGHGGRDPGNLGNGYMEKIIALKIALKAGELLSKNKGIKVIYTRDSDKLIDLFERGQIANKAKADLFISIHCDSHTSNAHGAGTFVLGLHANKRNFDVAKKENSAIYLEENFEARYAQYNINSPESVIGLTIMQETFLEQSIALAKVMQDKFTKDLKRNNRKVKQAGFIVLHQTFMPSILVETGFLTNANEGAYLNSKKGQAEMAAAIASAVLEYKNTVQSSSSVASESAVLAPSANTAQTTSETEKAQAALQNPPQTKKTSAPEGVAQQPSNAKPALTTRTVPEKPTSQLVGKESLRPPLAKEGVKEHPQAKLIAAGAKTTAPNGIVFKVQLMAVSKKIPLNSANFNGLSNLSTDTVGRLTRYLYGNTPHYSTAKENLLRAIKAGYPTAFIAAYKSGEKISLSQALKSLEQP